MQRIKPADPASDAQLAATYERITQTRGYVSNILMSLSHAPKGLDRFAAFGEYVRYDTMLPGRVRELVVLTVARGNDYAWRHHHPHAVKAGVSAAELESLRTTGEVPSASEAERAAMHYAREFAQGGNVSDETFAALRRHYSDRQITDLTLLVGYFMALGATINAFRVELEPAFRSKGA